MVLLRSVTWMKTWISVVGVMMIALAGLSACGQAATTISGTPIVIGVSLATSGDFADDGKQMEIGYQLWADTINKTTGLQRRPVQLDILHDNSDPKNVASNYEKLITQDRVDLLFGPFSTLLTKTAACIALKHNYPLIEGAGGGPSVFNLYCDKNWQPISLDPGQFPPAGAVPAKNVFDVSLPVQNNLVSFALYVLSLPVGLRPLTAAYATEDDPFTAPQVTLARHLLEQGGVQTVYNLPPYDPTKMKMQDYQKIANDVMKTRAEVGVFGTVLPDISAFIQTFRGARYTRFKALIATAGPDLGDQFVKAVGGPKNAEGIFVPNGWYPQADNYQNADMVATYIAKYGGAATGINADVAEAYAVGQVMMQAITKINSIDNGKLLNTLHDKNSIFNSVQGVVKFDATGQNTASQSYLFQWQNGTLLPVFPDNAAIAIPELSTNAS